MSTLGNAAVREEIDGWVQALRESGFSLGTAKIIVATMMETTIAANDLGGDWDILAISRTTIRRIVEKIRPACEGKA